MEAMEKYEQYLSDQFPGRNVWIGMKVTTERLALQEDVNGVYFGKDGYLIEKFDTEDLEGEQLNKIWRSWPHLWGPQRNLWGRIMSG